MENYSVVVMLCHSLLNISAPICHEEIVVKQMMSAEQCSMSQPAIAEWKNQSIFKSDEWSVLGFKCSPGNYIIKDNI